MPSNMTHWNYRVGRKSYIEHGELTYYGVYEVYYDKEDVPDNYIPEPISVTGNDLVDIKRAYNNMQFAFSKPVLDMDNFPNEVKFKI